MRVCVLEISPAGPLDDHAYLYDDKRLQFFYVTHNKKTLDKRCLAFRFHDNWADNRSYLAAHIDRSSFDYLMFIDYDVQLKSLTSNDVVTQLLHDLHKTHPAVLVPTAVEDTPQESYHTKLFSNNQVKIVHSSLVDYFFPLPSQFGGFWDCASFWNVLEIPLQQHVVCTPYITTQSTVSDKYIHNTDHTVGHSAMQASYDWIRPAIRVDVPADIDQLKAQYSEGVVAQHHPHSKWSDKSKWLATRSVSTFFDLCHEHFTRRWQEHL